MEATGQSLTVQLCLRDNYAATILKWFEPSGLLLIGAVLIGPAFFLRNYFGPVRVAVLAAFVFGALTFLETMWIRRRSPSARAPIVHTFSDTGITSKLLELSVTVNWNVINNAKETKHYIVIRPVRGGSVMVIPKRQLDQSQLLFVRRTLSEFLPGRTRLSC